MSFFTPDTFRFLEDLAENNRREWFEANRERYDESVRLPAQRFILAVGERLDRLSPHLRADPRPVGGSLFRIHRDVRFSRDKRPYKTATGIQFRHAAGRDAHAPGLYLHIEPGACFVGLGIWRPGREALRRIRDAIVEDPEAWIRARDHGPFRERFELGGESLVRGPRGFDLDHPLMEDIRRKDFVGMCPVSDAFVASSTVAHDFLALAGRGTPLLRFLCEAVGADF